MQHLIELRDVYKIYQMGDTAVHALDGVTLTTRENYAGARVIRAFAAEDAEQAGFNKRNEMLSHLQRSVGRLSALLNPLTYILINIGIVVLIHTGAMRVSLGDLTQGQGVGAL